MKQRSAMVNLRNYPAVTKRKEGFDEEKEKEEDELVKREVKRNKTGEELIGGELSGMSQPLKVKWSIIHSRDSLVSSAGFTFEKYLT